MATLAVTNTFAAGTTIVAADMNENFDDIEAFVNTTPGVVQVDIVDAKGDIIAATAADAVSRLAVGSNTYVLTADSTEATGLIWAAPTTGDLTGLTAGTNIDISSATGPVPTIDLAVDAALVTGVDGTGVDVTFHSATAGDNMLWDASEEKLVITGTDGQNSLEVADGDVEITDKLTVTGQIITHLLVSTESGTTHAPALGDENAYILTTHGTGIVVTLPQNSAQAFAIGATIYYERNGAGTLTFAAGTGATTTSKDSTLTCGDRYTAVCALKIGTNAWSLIGNIG
jgi:hypothetical protein